jgi:predicted outer membrane protein
MLDDLKAKSGKDFDQSYDQIQVKAHEEAVALFNAYAKGGDDLQLKEVGGENTAQSRAASHNGAEAEIGSDSSLLWGFSGRPTPIHTRNVRGK